MFALAGLVAACGGGGDGPGIVNAPEVVGVTIPTPPTNTIDIGETVQLTASVEVKNGASQAVEWSSGSTAVATVSQSGLVTGVSGGIAILTATSTANRSKTATTSITVNPARVVSVTLNSGARSLKVGENFAVVATVDTRGPLAKTVTFGTSNSAAATVSSADGQNATIVAVGAGQATITAKSNADPSKTASLVVTVSGSVRITSATPPSLNIRTTTSAKITPTVQADPGVSNAVTFASQNNAIATVSGDGTVTGVAVGQTSVVITAVADAQQKLTVPVTVRSGVTSVSLTPDLDSVRPTLTRQFAFNVTTEAGVSNLIALSSSNTAVATVDVTARVTGVAPGEAYIRAISVVDPSVGDSTLIVVVDPCKVFPTITLGSQVTGSISDASCEGRYETFKYRVNSQTTLALTANASFAGEFRYLSQLNAWWYFGLSANSPGTGTIVVAPGQYYATVGANSVTQRGAFTLTTTPNVSITNFCSLTGTTGITVFANINACSFQPNGRPTGTYNSYSVSLLPYFFENDKLTITVQSTSFIPLIELHFNSLAPVVAIAPGTNTATLTYTVPPGGGFASVFVSSRDAGQTGPFSVNISGPPAGTIGLPVPLFAPGGRTASPVPPGLTPATGLPGLPARP